MIPAWVSSDDCVGDIETLTHCTSPTCPFDRFRQPEVEHLHGPVASQLDVRGFEIAVDDALLVRRFEGLGDLLRDRQRLIDGNRPARGAL